jgi:O-antigen/teichoic acid export membrane protein
MELDGKNIDAKRNRRIASGVAAHLYSQLVTVVTQLAALPIFLTHWSSEQYGQWLIIAAIPIYLSIADAGVLTAAGNSMLMHSSRGEIAEVKLIFKASLLALFIIVPSIALISGAVLVFIPVSITPDQQRALYALILGSLLSIASGLFDAAYRSFGKYPRVSWLLATARIAEWIGMIVGLFIGGNMTAAGIGFLLGRTFAFISMYALARRDLPNLEWNIRGVKGDRLKQLIRPGLGFISITIGSLLTLQGMVLLVGAELGGAAVAIFSSSRTLTRLVAQIAILAGKNLSPEISALYGAGKHHDADRLNNQMIWVVMVLTAFGTIFLAIFGRYIITLWGRGKLPFNSGVYFQLLAAAIVTAYWQIKSVRLTSTNRHEFLAKAFLVTSVLVLIGSYLGMHHYGLVLAATGVLVGDITMVLAVTLASGWSVFGTIRLRQ